MERSTPEPQGKKSYTSPALVVYGEIAKLTLGSASGAGDGASGMMMP
jgi:hypothetical protein